MPETIYNNPDDLGINIPAEIIRLRQQILDKEKFDKIKEDLKDKLYETKRENDKTLWRERTIWISIIVALAVGFIATLLHFLGG